MLTFFAIPKPFRGSTAALQRNALRSWAALRSRCEVLLFGNEEGVRRAADTFGLSHAGDVARNEYGTPVLSDLFDRAQRLASHDLLCFVNSDIILMDDFLPAAEAVRQWRRDFLMVGQCWDVEVPGLLDFDRPEWRDHLRSLVRERGKLRGPWGIDYFVFPRGLFRDLPPFVIGRAGFDNWLIWKARALKAAVVDASGAVMAVHQHHDYAHVPGGKDWSYEGEEARRNLALAGGKRHYYVTQDATHRLGPAGITRHFGSCLRLRFRWERAKKHTKRWLNLVRWHVMELTRPIRHPLGLRMATFERLKARLTGHG